MTILRMGDWTVFQGSYGVLVWSPGEAMPGGKHWECKSEPEALSIKQSLESGARVRPPTIELAELLPPPDFDDLFHRACRAYFRRFGPNAMQPSYGASELTFHGIRLENVNGVLAEYRYYPASDRLRYVEVQS